VILIFTEVLPGVGLRALALPWHAASGNIDLGLRCCGGGL
jgi:hypothetical protein